MQVCYDLCVFTRVPLSSFLLLFSASQKLKEKQSSFVKDTTLKVYEVNVFACIYKPHSLVSNKTAGGGCISVTLTGQLWRYTTKL